MFNMNSCTIGSSRIQTVRKFSRQFQDYVFMLQLSKAFLCWAGKFDDWVIQVDHWTMARDSEDTFIDI